jgi:aryl-alcohol dehydrogenase (NADP+)
MDYVTLGNTGLKVSRLCLGTMTYGSPAWRPWVLSEEASRPFIKRALELGITFFDTADMYSVGASEEVLGRALRDFTSREQVVIATKVYHPMGTGPNDQGLSRKHLFAAIDASLRRLGVEYVDLYQIHRWDPRTPMEETLEALHDIVKAGKALYIGASNMHAWQFERALNLAEHRGWTRFVSMQDHYNLIYREEEREMLPLCRFHGIGVIPWSPMARGLLAGNREWRDRRGTARATHDDYGHGLYGSDADLRVADRVAEVAAERGVHPAQLALAWVVSQPGVAAPIIGATKLEHLEQAVGALAIRLTDHERARLEELYVPHQVLGIDF